MTEVDFEREGLLEGVADGHERAARLDLLEQLHAAGVPLEELRRAVDEDRLALLPVELVFARDAAYTTRETARITGLDQDFLRREVLALGLPWPAADEPAMGEADLDGLRGLKLLLDAGVAEDDLLELVRVVGQASARIATGALQLLGDLFMQPGDTERDLGLRYADAATQIAPFIGPMLENPTLLHVRETIRREVVGRAERATGRLPGARDVAICFADLVGFTSLGEQVEASELGAVAGRLADIATEMAAPPIQFVKTIGDAVMLVSPDAHALVGTALDLIDAAGAEPRRLPPLRAGVAYGPALGRAGDWYGRSVNLASRVTTSAQPDTVLATAETRSAAGDGYQWLPLPGRKLKGIDRPVALFRASRHPRQHEAITSVGDGPGP